MRFALTPQKGLKHLVFCTILHFSNFSVQMFIVLRFQSFMLSFTQASKVLSKLSRPLIPDNAMAMTEKRHTLGIRDKYKQFLKFINYYR